MKAPLSVRRAAPAPAPGPASTGRFALLVVLAVASATACQPTSPRVDWRAGEAPGPHLQKRARGRPLPRFLSARRSVWLSPELWVGKRPDADARAVGWSVWVRLASSDGWSLLARLRSDEQAPIVLPGEGSFEVLLIADPNARRPPGVVPADALVTVDETPPRIERFESRRSRAGDPDRIELLWTVTDATFGPSPVAIERSEDGGATWALEKRVDASGLLPVVVTAPQKPQQPQQPQQRENPATRFRLRALDAMGNLSHSRVVEVTPWPHAGYPKLRAPAYVAASTLRVEYDLGPAAPGAPPVLWRTSDGGRTWRREPTSPTPADPRAGAFVLDGLADGSYRFELALGGKGARDPRGAASASAVVDTVAPRVDVVEAREHAGEASVRVLLDAADIGPAGLDRLVVFASWRAEGPLEVLASYEPARVLTLPTRGRTGALRLHVVAYDRAGNHSDLVPAREAQPVVVHVGLPEFTVDGLAAAGIDRAGNRAPGPEARQAPDAWVTVTEPGDARGLILDNFHGGELRGGDRRYVFWRLPGEGLADLLAERPFSLHTSRDGGESWEPLPGAEALPRQARRFAWTLPRWEGETALLEVRAALSLDSGGRETLRARSARPFLVESRPPRVVLTGPPATRETPPAVSFHAWSPRSVAPPRVAAGAPPTGDEDGTRPPAPAGEQRVVPIAGVECYASRVPLGEWALAGTFSVDASVAGTKPQDAGGGTAGSAAAAPASAARSEVKGHVQGTIPLNLGDGTYEVALIARDAVGNASPSSGAPESRGRLVVDTVPPLLRVEFRDATDLYAGGTDIQLRIHAEDPHLKRVPVAIALLSGAADTAAAAATAPDRRVLEPAFPAAGGYSFTAPERSGVYTVEVTATDVAGNTARVAERFFVTPVRPRVAFRTFREPARLRGGERAEIRWETSSVKLRGDPVTILLSRDDGLSWETLATGLENLGVWVWQVPEADFRGGRLKIEVHGAGDQIGEALSAPFVVSSTVPRVRITRIEGRHAAVPASAPDQDATSD